MELINIDHDGKHTFGYATIDKDELAIFCKISHYYGKIDFILFEEELQVNYYLTDYFTIIAIYEFE